MVQCNHSLVIKRALLFNYTPEAHFLRANRSISLLMAYVKIGTSFSIL